MQVVNVVVPEDCHLWKDRVRLSMEMLRALEKLTVYEDDSHLIRRLERCRECGQLYFYEFYEEIDWVGGNDAQYRTWIPVSDEESAVRLSTLSPAELLVFPSIRADWPCDAREMRGPAWSGGPEHPPAP